MRTNAAAVLRTIRKIIAASRQQSESDLQGKGELGNEGWTT